jgi:hypothetical protein
MERVLKFLLQLLVYASIETHTDCMLEQLSSKEKIVDQSEPWLTKKVYLLKLFLEKELTASPMSCCKRVCAPLGSYLLWVQIETKEE